MIDVGIRRQLINEGEIAAFNDVLVKPLNQSSSFRHVRLLVARDRIGPPQPIAPAWPDGAPKIGGEMPAGIGRKASLRQKVFRYFEGVKMP